MAADTSRSTYIALEDRKRHSSLWFDDGNIVLATRASIFRVHRGLLSKNSPVFSDMLSMPQPETMEPTFDGLPIVELSDDDTDFTHILNFFYDRRYYLGGMPTTFSIVSGLLRMSTKYQVDELRDEIISHLAIAYPRTFEKYLEAVKPEAQLKLFPSFPGQHFAMVTLARETNAYILLPAALWRSSCVGWLDITRGIVGLNGDSPRLPPNDRLRCLLLRHAFGEKSIHLEHTLPRLWEASTCKERGQDGRLLKDYTPCQGRAVIKTSNHFANHHPKLEDHHDHFTQMNGFAKWRTSVCDVCRNKAESELSSVRSSWWEQLPVMVGLPAWKDL
ncbi:hypothetical protein BD410DRAFT_795064 [Rickenella mellea]|uniref:BTB domain-containing protein n=1 Tax=Rickenella mellea TaxID=50990 RepID=A0A4Y7PNV1_9AGAM|nr:hypothetical protein BD410DRAFT_795064 [Rickenella mellea]